MYGVFYTLWVVTMLGMLLPPYGLLEVYIHVQHVKQHQSQVKRVSGNFNWSGIEINTDGCILCVHAVLMKTPSAAAVSVFKNKCSFWIFVRSNDRIPDRSWWFCQSAAVLCHTAALVLITAHLQRVKVWVIILQIQVLYVLEQRLIDFNVVSGCRGRKKDCVKIKLGSLIEPLWRGTLNDVRARVGNEWSIGDCHVLNSINRQPCTKQHRYLHYHQTNYTQQTHSFDHCIPLYHPQQWRW